MSRWIRIFHPVADPAARLVCFPHAGGTASSYAALSEALARQRIQVLAVQYPGRHERFSEPCVTDADELVAAVLGALPVIEDGQALGLLGHSMGAVLAFETAHRLRDRGVPVTALFASARHAPSTPWVGPDPAERDEAEILADTRWLGGMSDSVLASRELVEFVLPSLRGDYRLLAGYRYRARRAPLDCPLVTLVGDADPAVSPEDLLAWRRETAGDFRRHVLPGGHFYLDDRSAEVAALVGAALRDEPHEHADKERRTEGARPGAVRRS